MGDAVWEIIRSKSQANSVCGGLCLKFREYLEFGNLDRPRMEANLIAAPQMTSEDLGGLEINPYQNLIDWEPNWVIKRRPLLPV